MNVYRNTLELIGRTPLVELNSYSLPRGIRLFAKLEFMNPGGSVKDRVGKALIEKALKTGQLKPGGTLIEATAGNAGIGLAMAALHYDISVIFAVPEKFSQEKQDLMKALGARIVHTPTSEGMKGAIEKTKQLAAEIKDAYLPQQFSNPDNPEAYYTTMGPEIWNDLDGKVDVFVAGAGSGGTFMGTSRYLKEQNAAIKTVIVEPEGSILNGGESGPHKTEGIGMELIPEFVDKGFLIPFIPLAMWTHSTASRNWRNVRVFSSAVPPVQPCTLLYWKQRAHRMVHILSPFSQIAVNVI